MISPQRRKYCAYDARILCGITALLFLPAFASTSGAEPSVLDAGPSHVLFDPSYTPPVGGGSLVTMPAGQGALVVVSPLTFNFTPVGNLLAMQSGTPALQALAANVVNGFIAAADIWRSYFADPITVSIDIDFGPIGNGVLGGNASNYVVPSYSLVRNALTLDAQSADDAIAVASLQPGGSLDFITNDTAANISPLTSLRIRDNQASGTNANNNSFLGISRANAKALGFALAVGQDSSIAFTDFTDFASPFPTLPSIDWDFDPSDGIAPNRIDFVGVAMHEIGHAMGFESGVDNVDYFGSPNGPGRLPAGGGPLDLDQFAVYTTLDLYRFSANSLAQASQPVGGLRDLAMGQFDASSRPYFSINSGATSIAQFSTGGFNGDGAQASHWRDNFGIGIMDPTFGTGELGLVKLADRRAMDVIGWDPNLVPEPGAAVLALLAASASGLMLGARRRALC
jgi:hypothetical protein